VNILNACAGLLLFIVALPYVLEPLFKVILWYGQKHIEQLEKRLEQEQKLELKQMLKRIKV
jgi:hypothetical protein